MVLLPKQRKFLEFLNDLQDREIFNHGYRVVFDTMLEHDKYTSTDRIVLEKTIVNYNQFLDENKKTKTKS